MNANFKKAEDLSQVSKIISERPLEIKDLDNFYIDTNIARGERTRSRMSLLLNDNINTNQHILFVGYRGCGKSTEIKHLEKDIQKDFLTINFSVEKDLDLNNISYIDLIIATMKNLFEFVVKENLSLDELFINNITDFLKIKEIEEIRKKYMSAEVKTGAEAKTGIPYISKFFIAFTGSLKGSKSLTTVLKETVEPHYSDLVKHCNALINEIRLQLQTLGKKDLVIIIEDLDKINIDRGETLFFRYSRQLTQINANIIYTFPISLKYNNKFNTIKHLFTNIYELPMIMVHTKDGEKATEGYKTMRKIIAARMNLDLFEKSIILDNFIGYSGGCLRDLFRLIVNAVENSRIYNRETITKEDEMYAFYKLKKEYDGTIADNTNEKGEVITPVETYFKILNELNNNPKKTVLNTREVLELRQNLTILGYNGTGWCDVHPMAKEILKDHTN